MKSPLVIGGTGGSGTRVVAQIVRDTGFFMGTNLNDSYDAMDFVIFYNCWINQLLCYKQELKPGKDSVHILLMKEKFLECIHSHTKPIRGKEVDWGWKSPRSIYLLQFLHSIFLKMKYIHVIRDGRDMAFSKNQNQLLKYGDILLGKKFSTFSQPARSAALWNTVNLTAADYGEKHLENRYLQVLYEDLCQNPKTTIDTILNFIGSKNKANTHFMPSEKKTIGRWKNQNSSEIKDVESFAATALERFGYL